MIRLLPIGVLSLAALGCSTGNNDSVADSADSVDRTATDRSVAMPYFPADVFADGRITAVRIDAASAVFFNAEFEKHDLYSNGYCMAGVVEQLVEKNAPDLLPKITFDPESDTCFISCADRDTMIRLAELIHKYCSSNADMLQVLESIDRSRLDC